MQTIYFLIFPYLILLGGGNPKEEKSIASNHESLCSGKIVSRGITYVRNEYYERIGKCYGYANCTACKTCNYCAHCNSGGSCGVCSGFSSYGINPGFNRIKPQVTKKDSPTGSKPKYVVTRPAQPVMAISKGDKVNIRSYPTLHSESMAKIDKGQEVEVLSRTPYVQLVSSFGWAHWYKVRWRSSEGWIFGILLEMDDQVHRQLDQEIMDYVEIEEEVVNVRQRPSLDSPILYKLERHDRITVIRRGDKRESIGNYGSHYWYLVAHEGVEGWVYGGVIGIELGC